MYKENPKTKGSGVVCAIPQQGRCPNNCKHCFFQGHGRSYLKPIEENTPNMPTRKQAEGRVVRVNDGNDSNHQRNLVIAHTKHYPMKFYNTATPFNIGNFDAPVVLTINPGYMTDTDWYQLDRIQKNLMFVRIRTNMWNLNDVVIPAVKYYTQKKVPVVLTFMAYYKEVDEMPYDIKIKSFRYKRRLEQTYIFRKRTLNSYWAITTVAWEYIMEKFKYNRWVHSCGKIEGEKGETHCRFCGNCLREYFATMERIKGSEL